MTWMSLPSTSYDKYVDPVNGNNNNNGNSWAQAYLSCAQAASASGSFGRVWLAPGTYTLTSPVSYSEKRIQWIAPPITAGFTDPSTGSAYFTGSGLNNFFNVEVDNAKPYQLFGGGFWNLAFNMNAITNGNEAIELHNCDYITISGCHARATSGTFRTSYLVRSSVSEVSPLAAGDPDRSWWRIENCSAFNCGLVMNGDPSTIRGSNAWFFANVSGDCDASGGATLPYIHNNRCKAGGWWIEGGFFRNNAPNTPCIKIDNTNVVKNRAVNIAGVTFEDLQGPQYRGIELYNCQATVTFGGGNGTTDGLIYGDSLTTGFMAVPNGSLTGSLSSGVN